MQQIDQSKTEKKKRLDFLPIKNKSYRRRRRESERRKKRERDAGGDASPHDRKTDMRWRKENMSVPFKCAGLPTNQLRCNQHIAHISDCLTTTSLYEHEP